MKETAGTRDTKERLLDAGEKLFAAHGFAGASARDITAEAGTSLQAINYHFGSKEGLFRAVVRQIIEPINEAQLLRLDSLETEKGDAGEVPSAKELIDTYAVPLTELLERDEARGRIVLRLLARVLAEAGGSSEQLALDEIEETEARYLRAFARVLPRLSREELWWRFQATRVVIVSHCILYVSGQLPETKADFRAWMLAYLTAAMCAEGAVAAAQR